MNDKHASQTVGTAHSTDRQPRRGQQSELAGLVREYVERDGRSLNRIAQAGLIDVAYLWRLRAGEKCHPGRDLLIRLGLALALTPEELDELLVAADYAPITSRRL